jgi:sigma-B regulation protein RsbU (phosphoserine phosphatase)
MKFLPARFLRRKLSDYGIYPNTVAGQITLYLFSLFLVLLVTQELLLLARRPGGAAELSGWVFGIGSVTAIFFLFIFLRWVRQVVMWRLRNRLIITYVFIGFIPVVLLALMAVIVGYLFAGQFAALEASNDIQSELNTLEAANQPITSQVATALREGRGAAENLRTVLSRQETVETRFPTRSVAAYLDGQPVMTQSANSDARPEKLPVWLKSEFKGATDEGGRVSLRVASQAMIGKQNLIVVSTVPFDQALLQRIAGKLGRIDISPDTNVEFSPDAATVRSSQPDTIKDGKQRENRKSSTKVLSGGTIPPQTGRFDQRIWFAAPLEVMDWSSGKSHNLLFVINTRPSALYARLFSTSVESAQVIWVLLIIVAVFLGVLEGFALLVGMRITRGITGSVSNLYRATMHINRGDFRHRIVIRSKDQLAALEGSFNSMTESLENLLREQKEKERLQSEIAIAQQVQAQLFPKESIQLSSLELHGICKPARTVSGDYYDFLPLGGERLGIAVGDISGKGISAALLMATVHSAVRVYEFGGTNGHRALQTPPDRRAKAIQSPAEVLGLLNRHLYNSTPEEKYATLFLSTYDGESRTLTYSNGGHLPPMLVGRDNLRRLDHGGTVVGLLDKMQYEEKSVVMELGEIFVAFSDGITEPENEFGEYGEHRLLETIRENFDLPLARISELVLAAVQDWIGAAEQPDDVTLVLARAR